MFITHRVTITIIESTLNKISHTFNIDREVDIIGNDSIISKKVEIDKKSMQTTMEIKTNNLIQNTMNNSDTELYASLKAKTDWKDNTETSVEVGFKKGFKVYVLI